MTTARLRPWARGLAGGAIVIAALTILSRLVGFGRWMVQAQQVGTTEIGTAYAAANTAPNVLFEVAAGGALAGAIVPLLASNFTKRNLDDVSRVASAILTWTLAVLLPLAIMVAILAPQIVALLPIGEDPDGNIRLLATFFLRVFTPQIPLYGIAVVLGGILQADRRFAWPTIAPAVSSIVVITTYLIYGKLAAGQQANTAEVTQTALNWLAWGTTLGVAAIAAPMIRPVLKTGVRLRPTFRLLPEEARRARSLAASGLGGLMAQQVAIVVVMIAALGYGTVGTLNVFQYSQVVFLLPYAVLALPIATSAFPRISARASQPELGSVTPLVATTTRLVIAVAIAGAAALFAVAPTVESIFATITFGDVDGMSETLTWASATVVGHAVVFHAARCLYAIDEGPRAARATIAGWLAVAGLAIGLCAYQLNVVKDGEPLTSTETLTALAQATSLGLLLATALLLVAMRRTLGADALARLGRTSLIVAVVGVATAMAGRWILGDGSESALAGFVGGVSVGGAIVVVTMASYWRYDRTALRQFASDNRQTAP